MTYSVYDVISSYLGSVPTVTMTVSSFGLINTNVFFGVTVAFLGSMKTASMTYYSFLH